MFPGGVNVGSPFYLFNPPILSNLNTYMSLFRFQVNDSKLGQMFHSSTPALITFHFFHLQQSSRTPG